MTDLQKRHTLKLIGGTGIGVGTIVSPLVATALNAGTSGKTSGVVDSQPIGVADLHIDIISTTAIPEQSVILTNNTNDVLQIDRFIPGAVVFEESMVDLNSLITSSPIVLEPHHSLASIIDVRPVSAHPILEYVWASDAISPLSPETDIISVGVFVADRQAVVYPLERSSNLVA